MKRRPPTTRMPITAFVIPVIKPGTKEKKYRP
jgi:hypothetical protein